MSNRNIRVVVPSRREWSAVAILEDILATDPIEDYTASSLRSTAEVRIWLWTTEANEDEVAQLVPRARAKLLERGTDPRDGSTIREIRIVDQRRRYQYP